VRRTWQVSPGFEPGLLGARRDGRRRQPRTEQLHCCWTRSMPEPTWPSDRAMSTVGRCRTGRSGAGPVLDGQYYARTALGVGVHDITAATRLPSRSSPAIDLDAVDSKGYCFQIDLTWRTINSGFVVVEVPITFTERELGVSKMSGSNIREALVKVTRWGVQGALGAQPVRSAAALRTDQVQALLEQLFQLFDRATLQQHVPVGTRRLHLLRLGRSPSIRVLPCHCAQPVAGISASSAKGTSNSSPFSVRYGLSGGSQVMVASVS